MIFSLGGGRNRLAIASAVLLMTAVGACSSDASDGPAAPTASPSASATPEASDDEAELTALYERYWAGRTEAENAADPDPARFRGIADGPFVEEFLKKVRDAAEIDVTRQGAPTIDQVEVAVTGDTATILSCMDEDDWTFFGNGTEIEAPDSGPTPTGATAEKRAEGWILTGAVTAPVAGKTCA